MESIQECTKKRIVACLLFGNRPHCRLVLETILHAPAAGAEGHASGQNGLGLAVLSDLGERIDDTTDEANENGRHAAEGDGCIEEDKTTESDGKLVQSSDHGVCGRRCDTNSPSRGI